MSVFDGLTVLFELAFGLLDFVQVIVELVDVGHQALALVDEDLAVG